MDTDALIAQIAGNAAPVQRLRRPWTRACLWFALAIPSVVIVVAGHGLDVDFRTVLADGRFWVEQAATLATALSAAYAAFVSTVPGSGRKWLWLPLVPLTIWLLAVGQGCLDEWEVLGPAGLSLRVDTGCLLPMVLISIVPTIAMVAMLRRGAPLSPRLTLLLGMLATAAIVNSGLRLFHIGDISFMVLIWHFGLVIVVSVAAGAIGPRLLAWDHRAALQTAPR